jgi:hypothetical protein
MKSSKFPTLICIYLFIWGMMHYANAQTNIAGSSITLVGTDTASATDTSTMLVNLPTTIQSGDVTFLFLGQSDAGDLNAPSDWTPIVSEGPNDINQKAFYRVYQAGQNSVLSFSGAKNNFVAIVTLRGVDPFNPVLDEWSGKDTDVGGNMICGNMGKEGHLGRAKATVPIATASDGVRFLTCMYDDPFIGEVFTSNAYTTTAMDILEAWANGDDGLMVAIEGTNGSNTSDRYIQGHDCVKGGGNDVVLSITINPISNSSEVVIDWCENSSSWTSANTLTTSNIYQEGSHSVQATGSKTRDFSKNFATKNAVNNNTLSFWYYISDVSLLNGGNQVELGSGGTSNINEYNWDIDLSSLQNGWNQIELPFWDADTTGGTPDLSQLNWFRLGRSKSDTITSRVDDIRLVRRSAPSEVVIDWCESTTDWNSANTLTTSSDYQEGSFSLQSTGSKTRDFRKNFATKNAGNNNTLSFWYYISDKSKMNNSNQVELGSGGTNDVNEYNWHLALTHLQNGWNKIELPFSAAATTGGVPDLSQLNWFRLYRSKSDTLTSRIDDIRLIYNNISSSRTTMNPSNTSMPSKHSFVTERVHTFKVFPNPAHGRFKLLLNNPKDPVTIRMVDLQGRVVLEQISHEAVTVFDVAHLAKGIYVLNITNKQRSENITLVLQ